MHLHKFLISITAGLVLQWPVFKSLE